LAGEDFILDVAVQGARFSLRDGGIKYNLQHGADKVRRAAIITAESCAPDVENYMKMNAPWQDQTGNARNGLFARPYVEGDNIGIELGHSVPYGIWLEVRWDGKYAIIQPTLDEMGPFVMRRFNRLLDRAF
jgi:hypothetical protein